MSERTPLSLVLGALLLAAFNLRIGVAEVGPVIEQIRAETGMSSAAAGLFGSLPYLCMGLFSFGGPGVIRRFGLRRAMIGGLILIGGGTLLRAALSPPLLIVLATVPIGVGMAVIGIAIPIEIKRNFPGRSGAVTAAYTLSMAVGLTVIALLIVPLSNLLGGWRIAFALTAIPAFAAIALCLAALQPGRPDPKGEPARPDRPPTPWWRPTRLAIHLGLLFGFQSFSYSSMLGWGAAIYQDAGWSPERAAIAISSLGILAIIGSAFVTRIPEHSDRRIWLVGMLGLMVIGQAGTGLAPESLGPLWMFAFGLSCGALLPLIFVLPIGLAHSSTEVGELTAWMLGLGYSFSGLGPILTGLLRDLSGDFLLPTMLLTVSTLLSALLTSRLPRVTLTARPS